VTIACDLLLGAECGAARALLATMQREIRISGSLHFGWVLPPPLSEAAMFIKRGYYQAFGQFANWPECQVNVTDILPIELKQGDRGCIREGNGDCHASPCHV
jgi:hypothetical protein